MSAAARKGRPRDERIGLEITSAALDVLAESGFVRFSIAEVVELTGVAKTTIYRRFATRDDLIASALDRLNDYLPADPPPGTIREQLIAVVDGIMHRRPDARDARIFTHAMSEATQEPAIACLVNERVLAPRRALLRHIIERGIATGELRGDVAPDLALTIIIGPALYISKWRMTDDPLQVSAEQLVDIILGGMTPASGSL